MKTYTPSDFPQLSNAQADRTARQINSMHPTVAERFYNSVTEFNNDPDNVSQGRVIAVSSGYRSPAESDAIKATSPGRTASGGNSWHNYEAAGDVIVLTNGQWDQDNSTGAYTGKATEIFERNGLTNPYKSDDSGHFQPVEFTNRVPNSVKDGSTTISDLLGEPNEPVVDDRLVDGNVDTGETADAITGDWTPPETPFKHIYDDEKINQLSTSAAQGNQDAKDELYLGYKKSIEQYLDANPGKTLDDYMLSEEGLAAFDKRESSNPLEIQQFLAHEKAMSELSVELSGPIELGERSEGALQTEVTEGITVEEILLQQGPKRNIEGPFPNWATSVDLPVYKLTLYLVKNNVFNNPSDFLNPQTVDSTIRSGDALIITQTGVETIYSIDNLLFNAVLYGDETEGSAQTSTMQFELREPIGFTLLDKILAHSKDFGFQHIKNAHYVITLEFLARDTDTGAPVRYPGTHYYPFMPYRITSSSTQEGTSYVFTCLLQPSMGAAENVLQVGNVSVRNVGTVGGAMKELERKLNQAEELAVNPNIGSIDAAESSSARTEIRPRKVWKIEFDKSATVQAQTEGYEAEAFGPPLDLASLPLVQSNSGGEARDEVDSVLLTVNNNTNLSAYIKNLITKNPTFNKYVKDRQSDIESYTVPIVQVETQTIFDENDEIDPVTRKHYVTQVIKIGLSHRYGIPRAENVLDSEIRESVIHQNNRFNALPIVKKYEYLYSGENTEVLNFDIQFFNLFSVAMDPGLGANVKSHTAESLGTNLPVPSRSKFLSATKIDTISMSDPVESHTYDFVVSSAYKQQENESSNEKNHLFASYAAEYDRRKSDMNVIEMNIIGDPFLLGIPGSTTDPNHETMRMLTKNTNIYVAVVNYFGQINDDEDNLVTKGPMDVYSSGIYEIRKVEHRFQQGQYTNTITAYRDNLANTYLLRPLLEEL